MTTPTTSRVSDAMVEVAENAFWPVYLESIRVHQASKAAHSAGLRAALEAALASQGDVVAIRRDVYDFPMGVGELRGLYFGERGTHRGAYWWREDLSAVLNRGGK